MAKLAQEIIEQIPILYAELKTYTAVAKKLGISASTVSKYVKELKTFNAQTVSQSKLSFDKKITPIEKCPLPSDWKTFLILTEEEKTELKELEKISIPDPVFK